jgi:hypothetical protein
MRTKFLSVLIMFLTLLCSVQTVCAQSGDEWQETADN